MYDTSDAVVGHDSEVSFLIAFFDGRRFKLRVQIENLPGLE